MVFESLFSANELRNKPWKTMLLGIIYSSIGILVSLWVFNDSPSMSAVFLTTIAAIPLLVKVLKIEEEEDFTVKELPLIGNHLDVLQIILYLFLGLLFSFTAWYILLPQELSSKVFSSQLSVINSINSSINGGFTNKDFLSIILANNFKVMIVCLVFSFLYGSGSVFIITWNASVMSAAIGNAIKSLLSQSVPYFKAVPLGFSQYIGHGLLEMTAYLLAGIAGGIISAAVIRHKFLSKKFKEVVFDSFNLIMLASVILIISGLLEVLG